MNKNITTFTSPEVKESYSLYRHPSGLDVYIFPKKLTTAYAIFGTRYGSIDNTFKTDKNGEFITVPDGIAHFLEHKLFTNEDGSDSFERFSELGADANAYTSFNKTAYLFSCTENFGESLRELISFVTHPYFTEQSVAKERGIIAQEIKMYDDSPSDRCFYGMLEGMYKHHSIKRNICGTVETISKITPELLYDCHRVFYSPSNMALVVAGDIEPSLVIDIVDATLDLNTFSSEIIRSDENASEPREAASALVECKMNVSKPMFCIGIKDTDIPEDADERQRKDALMAILDEMLFSRCSDFYNDLLEREVITPSFSYGYTISQSSAYNSLAGEASDPHAVLDEVKNHIARTKKTGLDRSDFERAKRVMYAEYVKLFDSTESIANTLLGFACEESSLFGYGDILRSLTFEEVVALFERAFPDECYTLSAVYPINDAK